MGEATFSVPGDLPLGWHTLHAVAQDSSESVPLVVAPWRLDPGAIAGPRQWGLMTQVYSGSRMLPQAAFSSGTLPMTSMPARLER